MATEAFAGWDWEHPTVLSERMDQILVDMATCEKLEAVADGPHFGAAQLRELGVTGIEFAAWKSKHPGALASDLVALRGPGEPVEQTEPGHIYRIDGEYLFTQLDVCKPLPLDDASLSWAYAEHLIEHITLAEGIGWLRELRRVLEPGGLLRITTPDLKRYVDSYGRKDGLFANHRMRLAAAGAGPRMPDRDAFMFNQIFFLWGHRWIYDVEELKYALVSAGFAEDGIAVRSYRRGARPDVAELDRRIRNDESIYLEATA